MYSIEARVGIKATPYHSKHRLACRFSVIEHSVRLSMVRWTALNLYPLTKNLTAQYGT